MIKCPIFFSFGAEGGGGRCTGATAGGGAKCPPVILSAPSVH